MRYYEFVTEKASAKTCRRGNEGKKIGISARSSCVSQGMMPHKSHHTDGSGTQGDDGSGVSLNGKYAKGERYGGKVKDYGHRH